MKKLRLLTISATSERGGSDINLLHLLKRLDKNEYDVVHLVPYSGPLVDEFKNAGVRVEIVGMPRMRLFKNPLRYLLFILRFFPAVFKIRNTILKYNIDIVCTSSMVNLYGALAAKLARRPHILIATEYLPILRLASPYFYLLSDKIICCSNVVSRMFKKSNKVIVEYPGVDADEFNPKIEADALKKELGINAGLVSMVTRLDKWKGVETFIKAAKYVEGDARFGIFAQLVIGKEKYIERLKKIIRKLKLEEKVYIKLTRCTPELIAASDIVVHASLRPEPFGLAIIEAMAMEKPVIASRLGGPAEIISEGLDGILVEPAKPQLLATVISNLLKNPKTARELGLRAREKVVKRFNLKDYALTFDTILKNTVRQLHHRRMRVCFSKKGLVKFSFILAKLLIPDVHKLSCDITDKDSIKEILVIQLFGLGDLICSMPLVEAVKKEFPCSTIALLIDEKLRQAAELIDCQDKVIGYKRGILNKIGLIAKIKKQKFDMAVILNPLWQGVWIAYLARAKYRIGYLRDYECVQDIEELMPLLTHPLMPQDKPMHDAARYLEIIRPLGIEAEGYLPKLNIPQEATQWVDEFLLNNGIKRDDFILGVNPHAAQENKCWDAKRFAQVADTAIDNYHARVVIFGSSSADDTRRMESINSYLRNKVISAVGKTDIPRLAALIKKCDCILTNDSGPMHLAWALGLNIVALFGPSDINKFGYRRKNIINITANGAFSKPCILNYQCIRKCIDSICMRNIEVSEVIKALEIFIRK